MAYDEQLADRITNVLKQKKIKHSEKKMMGGLCYMVDDKMCFGIHFDKKKNTNLLMARVGPEQYAEALSHKSCIPMDFTGKIMTGYVFIHPEGYDRDKDLEYWIQLCLNFNPHAKASKKK